MCIMRLLMSGNVFTNLCGKNRASLASARRFLFSVKFCLVSIFLVALQCLHAYEPRGLKDQAGNKKYQFALRGSDFFQSLFWKETMEDYYGGCDNLSATQGVRRSFVPGAMVDMNGELFRVFQKGNSQLGIWFSYGAHNSARDLGVGLSVWLSVNGCCLYQKAPQFWYENDDMWFKYGIHNAFQPCIAQEVEGYSDNIYCFHYIPTYRLFQKNAYGYEGALWVKYDKSFSQKECYTYTDPSKDDMEWSKLLRRWVGDERPTAFPNCTGNYQAFVCGAYLWLFHLYQNDANEFRNAGITCTRYSCSDLTMAGVSRFIKAGEAGLNTAAQILPRFIKVGKYVYFATISNGYYFNLWRITPSQSAGDSVGNIEEVFTCFIDKYVENADNDYSKAPYSFDYCILEEDGTPALPSSSDTAGKILCVFGLGGGGSAGMSEDRNWKETCVNWGCNNIVGVIASVYFTGPVDKGSFSYWIDAEATKYHELDESKPSKSSPSSRLCFKPKDSKRPATGYIYEQVKQAKKDKKGQVIRPVKDYVWGKNYVGVAEGYYVLKGDYWYKVDAYETRPQEGSYVLKNNLWFRVVYANEGLLPAKAFAQNTIYVTGSSRTNGTFVDINDTSKTDLYRLYLNSHKIVPYTSSSGKHYMIYAYCYPGKKKHLYLGYAQYFVDANHEVRLLTQVEFKAASNSGWGDSFDGFTNCDRIISMDLRGGHLWITFMGNQNSKGDSSGYYSFHIKASDLVGE